MVAALTALCVWAAGSVPQALAQNQPPVVQPSITQLVKPPVLLMVGEKDPCGGKSEQRPPIRYVVNDPKAPSKALFLIELLGQKMDNT